MEDRESERPQDDFAVEITDLNQSPRPTRRAWLRLTPRQRKLSLAATALLFVLVVLLLLGSTGDVGSLLGRAIGNPVSTPDPGAPATSMSVYLRGNPGWGHFTLDGKALAHVPAIGREHPLELARGQHTIVWQAEPFKAKTCVFTVVDASTLRGPCFLDNSMTPNFEPGISAVVIAFFASLNDLPANQRARLTQQLQTTFASYDSTTRVQPGERYAVSEQLAQDNPSLCQPFESIALCYAQAAQPLNATLHLQVDNLTSNNDPCVMTSQCDSYRQDCRALCEDPTVSYGPQDITGWRVDVVVSLVWSYRDLNGQLVASDQPNTAIRGTQTYQMVPVHLNRAGQGGWEISPFPTEGYVSDNPVCAQATGDTMTVLGASFDNNSSIYVRQSFSNLTQMADGCLTIASQPDAPVDATPTPTPAAEAIPPAAFLSRFGVLLAANASAHKICPDLPVANAAEKSIAQSLQALA
jgi:hypothetical protein